MVARDNPPDEGANRTHASTASALFNTWRRLLGAGAASVRQGTGGALIAAGLLALSIGAAGQLMAGREDIRTAAASSALMVMWSLARLALMRMSASTGGDAERAVVTRAWAVGLLPYLVAVTPVLHVGAWAVSAALGYRILIAGGFTRRRASWCIAWGHGSQAAGAVAAWIVRNALVAGAALTGR